MRTTRLPTLLLAASLGAMTPLLQGCFPVVAAGVAAGVIAVTDRRSLATQTMDEEIEIKAESRIREKFGDKVHVNVTSYNRKVLLTGEATTTALKAEVSAVVRGVPNIDSVTDETVYAGTSSLTARSNDAYVTSKVKARFIEAAKFNVNQVKVVTEAGNVYLLGLVTDKEAKDAIEITRTTAGVRKVINLMETISDEQAKALDNRPQTREAAPVDDKSAAPKN